MQVSPVDTIKAIEKNVLAEVKMGLSELEPACGNALPTLLQRIRQMGQTVPMDQVTDALEYLTEEHNTFNLPQRREIAEVVKQSQKSEIVGAKSKKGWTMQTHLYLYNYLPALLWSILESNETLENKLKQLAAFMVQNLGLRHPCNTTKKMAVNIVLIASKQEVPPQRAYDLLHGFADFMDQKRTGIHSAQTIETFFEDVKKFQQIYPTAYGERDPPVECRIDLTSMPERMRKDITPSRSTNDNVVRQRKSKKSTPVQAVDHSPFAATNQTAMLATQQSFMQPPQPNANTELVGLLRSIMQRQDTLEASQKDRMQSLSSFANQSPIERSATMSTVAGPGPEDSSVIGGGVPPQCWNPPPKNVSVYDKLNAIKADVQRSADSAASSLGAPAEPPAAEPPAELEPAAPGADAAVDPGTAGPKTKAKGRPKGKGKAKGKAKADAKAATAMAIATPAKGVGVATATKVKTAKPTTKKNDTGTAEEIAIVEKCKLKFGKSIKFARKLIYAKLLKRLAAAPRPPYKKDMKPVHHSGGRIHWNTRDNCFRVYKRGSDKVEESVRVVDEPDKKLKYTVSCAMIEADPRPIHDDK